MIKLNELEVHKLAAITEVDPVYIRKLAAMNLISEANAQNVMMLHDFRKAKRRNEYKVCQLIEAVADKYKVPESRVRRIIYNRERKRFFCTNCGKVISTREKRTNHGLCRKCMVSSIKI